MPWMRFRIPFLCSNLFTTTAAIHLCPDQISDEKNTERHLIEGVSIKEGMTQLGERERLILTMRFYEGRTQMEVAEEIGISQAQVSRLEKAALKHLRKYMATS